MKIFKSLYTGLTLGVLLMIFPAVSAQHKLSLAEAIALASANNPELQASELDNEIADWKKTSARGLFLPTLGLSGQVNHYFQRTPFFGFGAETEGEKIPYGRFGGEDQVGVFLQAVQPLYNPVAGSTVKQANIGERQAALETHQSRINITSQIKETYLQILVLQERLAVERESLKRNKLVLRDSKSLFLQGKALRVDTLRAYTSVRNLEPRIIKLKYAIETGKLQLKTLTGIRDGEIELTDSLAVQIPVVAPDESEIYEAALKNNPEFQLLTLSIEKQRQDVSAARLAKLPQVSALAQYQVQSQTNQFNFGDAYYPASAFVGVQLFVPLFTGLNNHAKTQAAKLTFTQTKLRADYAVEQLKSRVHDAVALSRESLERLYTSTSVRETAELSYEIIQYRYRNGIASRLELTDAEFELNAAKSNYLEAVYDFLSSQIALSRLTGSN
jgi:outer membrane protein TolC